MNTIDIHLDLFQVSFDYFCNANRVAENEGCMPPFNKGDILVFHFEGKKTEIKVN